MELSVSLRASLCRKSGDCRLGTIAALIVNMLAQQLIPRQACSNNYSNVALLARLNRILTTPFDVVANVNQAMSQLDLETET